MTMKRDFGIVFISFMFIVLLHVNIVTVNIYWLLSSRHRLVLVIGEKPMKEHFFVIGFVNKMNTSLQTACIQSNGTSCGFSQRAGLAWLQLNNLCGHLYKFQCPSVSCSTQIWERPGGKSQFSMLISKYEDFWKWYRKQPNNTALMLRSRPHGKSSLLWCAFKRFRLE